MDPATLAAAERELRYQFDQITKDSRGEVYTLWQGEQRIGAVVCTGYGRRVWRIPPAWYVVDAGAGVPFTATQYRFREEAGRAVLAIRADSPALRVDEATGLERRDLDLLDVAGWWFTRAGSKAQAIRDLLHMTETTFYQRLYRLLDNPNAWAYAPHVLANAKRAIDARTAAALP